MGKAPVTLNDILLIAAMLPFLLYFVANLFLPWYRNPAGRAVMLLVFTCALTLSLSVYRQFVGVPLPAPLRMAAFVLIIVAGWTFFITFVVVARRARRRNRKERQ